MVSRLLIAWSLTALCVIVHAMGMTTLLRWENRWVAQVNGRYWFSIWLLVRTAGWIIFLHLDRDYGLGVILRLERRLSRPCLGLVFQRRHLHHDRLRRPGPASRVAPGRRGRGAHRHPDVRLVGGRLFHGCEPDVWGAIQNGATLTYVHETIHPLAVVFIPISVALLSK